MLKYQFTSRHNYNQAERINTFLWFVSILTASLAFFPSLERFSWLTLILFLIDIIVLILCVISNNAVQRAANLRAIFDDYVLGFNNLCIDKSKRTKFNEIVSKTVYRYDKMAKIQMNNNGNDNPPGVKDWYDFPGNFTGHSPILFCQRQNMWWTDKMMAAKSILFIIEAVILVSVLLLVLHISDASLLEKTICLLGFVIKSIDRILAMFKYCVCCLKIVGALKTQETEPTHSGLIVIQEMINELRSIPILGKNKCHQKLANVLSKCFKETVVE